MKNLLPTLGLVIWSTLMHLCVCAQADCPNYRIVYYELRWASSTPEGPGDQYDKFTDQLPSYVVSKMSDFDSNFDVLERLDLPQIVKEIDFQQSVTEFESQLSEDAQKYNKKLTTQHKCPADWILYGTCWIEDSDVSLRFVLSDIISKKYIKTYIGVAKKNISPNELLDLASEVACELIKAREIETKKSCFTPEPLRDSLDELKIYNLSSKDVQVLRSYQPLIEKLMGLKSFGLPSNRETKTKDKVFTDTLFDIAPILYLLTWLDYNSGLVRSEPFHYDKKIKVASQIFETKGISKTERELIKVIFGVEVNNCDQFEQLLARFR